MRGSPRGSSRSRRLISAHHSSLNPLSTSSSSTSREGFSVSRKRVARLMREAGLSQREQQIQADHRFRPFAAGRAKFAQTRLSYRASCRGLGERLTYVWTREGWLYLAAILDLYSRKVVGCDDRRSARRRNRVDRRTVTRRARSGTSLPPRDPPGIRLRRVQSRRLRSRDSRGMPHKNLRRACARHPISVGPSWARKSAP